MSAPHLSPPRRTPPSHTPPPDFRLASPRPRLCPSQLNLSFFFFPPSMLVAPRVRGSFVYINWALNPDRPLHSAPFHVGSRNLAPLSTQLDILVPGMAHTHEAPGFEGESEPPLPLLPALHTHCPGEQEIRTIAHVLQPASVLRVDLRLGSILLAASGRFVGRPNDPMPARPGLKPGTD